MGIDEIIKAIISAIIAFTVPTALKQFWPETEQVDSLPWFKWCVAGFVGGALGGSLAEPWNWWKQVATGLSSALQ